MLASPYAPIFVTDSAPHRLTLVCSNFHLVTDGLQNCLKTTSGWKSLVFLIFSWWKKGSWGRIVEGTTRQKAFSAHHIRLGLRSYRNIKRLVFRNANRRLWANTTEITRANAQVQVPHPARRNHQNSSQFYAAKVFALQASIGSTVCRHRVKFLYFLLPNLPRRLMLMATSGQLTRLKTKWMGTAAVEDSCAPQRGLPRFELENVALPFLVLAAAFLVGLLILFAEFLIKKWLSDELQPLELLRQIAANNTRQSN